MEKIKPKIKWQYELIIFAIILATVPTLIISLNLISKTESELTQSVNEQLTNITNNVSEDINSFFVNQFEKQFLVKKSLEDESLGINEKVALIVSTIGSVDEFISTSLIFKEDAGISVAVQSHKEVIDSLIENNHPKLFELLENTNSVAAKLIESNQNYGNPIYLESLNKWYIYSIVEVVFVGKPEAYLVSLIDLSSLEQKINNPVYGSIGNLLVKNINGESIFKKTDSLDANNINQDVIEILSGDSRVAGVTNYTRGDKKYVVSVAFPENVKWAVIAVEDYDKAYSLVSEMNYTLYLWIFVGLALALVAVVVITKRIRKPINHLVSKAKEISNGNFDIEVDYKSNDSIGTLGSTMESMSKSLKSSFQKIEKQNKELEEYNLRLEEKVKERTRELKETNNDLQKAYLKVLELNNEKNEFLGIAAHDLKNPLSAIKGFGMIIQEDELSREELTDFAGNIIDSSERMFDIIISLLDINRIEEGRVAVNYEETSVSEMVDTLIRQNLDAANKKGITIGHQKLESDIIISTDAALVLQVLENLFSNAIKFSPLGKPIELMVKNRTDSISITIKDNGPGISDEDKSKLFKKFKKLTARPTGGENSTGLGLSIAKKITEMLGGDILVHSVLGEGSEFKLVLPK